MKRSIRTGGILLCVLILLGAAACSPRQPPGAGGGAGAADEGTGAGGGSLGTGAAGGLTAREAEVPPAGAEAAYFADANYTPEWSPDGGSLLVTRSYDGQEEIDTIDLMTGAMRPLVHGPGADVSPHWNEELGLIVFASDRDGEFDDHRNLHVLDPRTGKVVRLTDNPFPSHYPRWSPDGTRVVFNDAFGEEPRRLYLFDPGKETSTPLTDSAKGHSDYASWTPDGEWIIFESLRGSRYETYRIRPDGSGEEAMTQSGASAPRISPDGGTMAFHEMRSDEDAFDIFTLDLETGEERLIAGGPVDQRLPSWSPDGLRIAFIGNDQGHYDVYIMNADGSGARRVTKQPPLELFNVYRLAGFRGALARAKAVVAEGGAPIHGERVPIRYAGIPLAEGRPREAAEILEIATVAFPESASILVRLGAAHLAAGDRGPAREAYARAAAISPDDDAIRQALQRLDDDQ